MVQSGTVRWTIRLISFIVLSLSFHLAMRARVCMCVYVCVCMFGNFLVCVFFRFMIFAGSKAPSGLCNITSPWNRYSFGDGLLPFAFDAGHS